VNRQAAQVRSTLMDINSDMMKISKPLVEEMQRAKHKIELKAKQSKKSNTTHVVLFSVNYNQGLIVTATWFLGLYFKH